MAKKRTAAKKRVTRKPQATRRRENPDATINTLVILLVIVMVLGGLFLYAQNSKEQAAQWHAILQTIAALPAPAPTARQPALPDPRGRGAETVQCRRVAGDPVVREVAHELLTQGPVLVL